MTQPLLLPMIGTRWGRIVSISSLAGVTGNRGQTNYAAAKAGLHGASKSLAIELASRGITVNVVAPGLIESPATREAFKPEQIEAHSADEASGYAGRSRGACLVPCVRASRIHHRPDHRCQRRHGVTTLPNIARSYWVVIPAYNEAETVRDVAMRARQQCANVVVVDDGSTDGHVRAVAGLDVTVLRNEENLGRLGVSHEDSSMRWRMVPSA